MKPPSPALFFSTSQPSPVVHIPITWGDRLGPSQTLSGPPCQWSGESQLHQFVTEQGKLDFCDSYLAVEYLNIHFQFFKSGFQDFVQCGNLFYVLSRFEIYRHVPGTTISTGTNRSRIMSNCQQYYLANLLIHIRRTGFRPSVNASYPCVVDVYASCHL